MGSGFKDWTAGDVLTAADVDGYLMRQTVMTFADASARDTALSGVLDEGMVAYLEDVDLTTYYTGSAWVAQPRNAYIGNDTNASYTLTGTSAEVVRVDATLPATNRYIKIDFQGTIDDIQAGGRIVTFNFEYSLDGGSTWTTSNDYNWWITYDASDQRPIVLFNVFSTSSNTAVSARVMAKKTGTTGILKDVYLLVTDIGAA